MILLLVSSLAFAGKLGDGWRGHPYGDATWLVNAPGDHCKAKPEEGVAWRCWEVIGAASYDVNYMVDEALYTGVIVDCSGFTSCQNLLATVTAAWGSCSEKEYASGPLPECSFGAETGAGGVGKVFGTWDFNQFSNEGYALSMAMDAMQKAKAIKAARAKDAAEGL